MQILRTMILVVGLAFFATMTASATSYYFPKFGTPIVSGKHLIFAGPGWEPHRIICISKDGGQQVWEMKDEKRSLHPWFLMDASLVFTKAGDVFSCDLNSGTAKLVYSTGYDRCRVSPAGLPVVLISGEKNDIDFLSLVDLRIPKKHWEVPRLEAVMASGKGVLLCEQAERQVYTNGSYSLRDQRLTAVSEADGKLLWTYPLPKENPFAKGLAIQDYFIVDLAGTVYCFEQKSGRTVNKLQIQESPYASVSLAERDGAVLVWTQEGHDVFSGHVVYSLSVPELKKSEILKTDWYSAASTTYGDVVIGMTIGRMDAYNMKTGKKLWEGGQWNWEGIHDGYIYFSTMDDDGKHTSVNSIRVDSGERTLIYREPLPQDMQWKVDPRPSKKEPERPLKSDYR
jgi:hypothetical protein